MMTFYVVSKGIYGKVPSCMLAGNDCSHPKPVTVIIEPGIHAHR